MSAHGQGATFQEIFQGRTDAWGALRGECMHEDVGDRHFARHLAGMTSLGVYPLLDDGRCRWATVDIDVDDLDLPVRLRDALAELGLNAGVYIERSKSKGYHVWLLFDELVSAQNVRRILKAGLAKAELDPGTEIFPKQDQLGRETRFGNYVNLPYYGNANGRGRRMMLRPDTLDPMPREEFLADLRSFPASSLALVLEALPPEQEMPSRNPSGWLGKLMGSSIPTGQRRPALTRIAGAYRAGGIDVEAAVIALTAWAEKALKEPLPEEEIKKTVRGIYERYGIRIPPLDEDVHETDMGNAGRLVQRHGQELRYCYPQTKWYAWDGTRWAQDDTGEVHRRAKETVRAIYREAAEAEDGRSKELAKHALRSESEARIAAMVSLTRPELPILPAALDASPWAFNVANGTIDLRTGELQEHRREDLITNLAPVTYDPNLTAPVFAAFMDTIMDGNVSLITYLQRTLGHALSGDMSEHRLEMWHGGGSNGKSTLFNAIVDVMGSYAQPAAPGLLLTSRHERHATEVADLKGARFVWSVEVGEGRGLAEETVKRLTERTLKARRMREDFSEFEASHKLFIAMNHKPTIRGGDHAIWRRIKLIPFNVTIPDADQDKQLNEKLRAERAGILNWLLAGLLDWQRGGFAEPEEVTAATLTYRTEQDVIARFIEDVCTTGPTRSAEATHLFNAWVKWCTENHERPLTQTLFGTRLREQGLTPGKTTVGARLRTWNGIGLRAQEELTPDSAQKQVDG